MYALYGDLKGLRPHDKAVYEMIVRYKQDHDGNSPTYQQIMDEVGLSSKSVANGSIKRLVNAKLIREGSPIELTHGRWLLLP